MLNWGPSYYHQRQFFEGKDNKLSTPSTLLRYDLEVSGFPSSHCGHLVLLRLREQDYPDARQIEDWPTWDLPILKWAKAQGAVTGFAHSGLGLQVKSRELPNYEMPNFDGIGANEYIMDVTHDVVDFISAADTPFVSELNIWYHTLNCGFRTRVSGETDFPCITDDRVGGGRSYVHLTQGAELRRVVRRRARGPMLCVGRLQPSHGLHGERSGGGHQGRRGAARAFRQRSRGCTRRLPASGTAERHPVGAPSRFRSVWTPEHARVGESSEVRVEVIVNGRPVATRQLVADGTVRDVSFDVAGRSQQLDRPAHPRFRAHQSDLRSRRRASDSRVTPKRGVVPEGRRPVLVAEVTPDRRFRPGGGCGRLRSRPRALSADPVGVRGRIGG